jgi:hypothetical protein
MADKTLSRRDFLKLLGAGGIILGMGWFGGIGSLYEQYKKGQTSRFGGSSAPLGSQLAYAQTSGTWVPGQNTQAVALGCALTPNNKIFYFAGSGWDNARSPNGPFEARYLDLSTGSDVAVPLSVDIFCVGMNQLQSGNILLTGGTLLYDTDINSCNGKWHGANYALEFNYSTGQLEQLPSMRTGRWYPTQVLLPNGKVVVVAGSDEYGIYNRLVEIYDPATRSWTTNFDPSTNNTYCVGAGEACAGAGSPCFGGPNQGVAPWLSLYPRMILMPSGLVYTSSQREFRFMYDPSTGIWTNQGQTALGQYRDYGTSILLPLQNTTSERGKVMVVGGAPSGTAPATRVVEIHDFNQGTNTNPVIRTVGQLNFGRRYILPIILPNGKIMVFGGSSQGGNTPVYVSESFDPENESQGWTTLAPATVPRLYHGTALLMTDGSVWTAGSTPSSGGNWELRTEFFRPSYFSSTRPTISGNPTVGGYGGSITIPTPDPTNIARVSLVKLGCTTHHYDIDMRLIWLQITSRGATSVTVSAPISANIAPEGYYMIHVLDNALVPSVANIIKIPGTEPTGPDTTVPTVAVTSPANNATVPAGNVLISGTSADNVGGSGVVLVEVRISDGPYINATPQSPDDWSNWSGVHNIQPGSYFIRARVRDAAGNVSWNPGTHTINVVSGGDTTPPAQVTGLTVTTPSGTSTQLNLAWTANTEADLNHYNVYRGTSAGFAVTPGTTPPIATPATNTYSDTGLTASTTYYYKVAAVDNANNIGLLSTESSGTTGSAGPDTTVPTVAVTNPANNATVPAGDVVISGTAADNVGGSGVMRVEVRVDSGAYILATPQAPGNWSTWTVTQNITATGSHTLRARVTDNAGNVSWNPGTYTINVGSAGGSDITVPTVAVTSPANNATVPAGNVLISGTSADNVGGSGVLRVEVRVDNGAYAVATPQAPGNWSTWTVTHTVTAIGSHTLRARVTDNAGNVSWNPGTHTINVV